MFPEVFHIGGFFLPTYGLLVAVAFLTALWITGRLAKQSGLEQESVLNLGIYCALAGIVGAKVLMIVLDPAIRDNWLFTLHSAGGGHLLRRLRGRAGHGHFLHAAEVFAGPQDHGCVRAWTCRGARYRAAGLLLRGLLLGLADAPALGGYVYEPAR
jgi:hypothetical protein